MINQQTLELYVYVDGVNDVPFLSNDYQEYILSNGEQFVTSDGKVFNVRMLNENIIIHAFTYNAKRMSGAPTITTTIKYPDCLDELFSQKVYATFNGEKYFLVATPSSSYSNEEIMYKHEATFVSERIALENTYFYDVVPENAETDEPVSNNSDFVLSLKIDEFATRMNYSLQYAGLQVVDENGEYVSGYKVIVDEGISSEEKFMSVENKFFSEVLQEVYNTYDLPYYFVGKEIHIGYSTNAISEVFRYGDSDALVSITKANANNRIINRATGIGSEDNIPYYYPNVTPKGEIKAIAASTNTSLTNSDISIVNPIRFAKEIAIDGEIEYAPMPPVLDIDYYSIINGEVKGNSIQEIQYLISSSTPNMQLIFDISNINTGELSGRYADPSDEPTIISWKNSAMQALKGFKPLLECVNAFWNDGSTDDVPDLLIDNVSVQWIIGKGFYIPLELDEWGGVIKEAWCFDVESQEELQEKNGFYKFPNLNVGSKPSRIRMIWDIKVNTRATYTLSVKISPYSNMSGWVYGSRNINLNEVGLAISKEPIMGDIIKQTLVENSYITPQKTLMPPIYRETLGAQRFYDAISGVHIIPDENGLDSGLKYEFENEYNGHNPKEQIVQFEEIKPTIKEMRNSEGLRIDMFSEIAFDENDNDEMYETPDGAMKYKHPLFFAKLRKLDFNLFDSAIDSGEMTIAMTDGSCSACEFKVAVDKDSKKNTVQVDENGDLVRYINGEDPNDERNGDVLCGDEDRQVEVDPQDIQQDTINNEVWIALYKDKDTFGEIMPSVRHNLAPKSCSAPTENDGDTFVILNISLPQRYIEYAEEQLEQQIIYFIYDNNREKFNFSVKFSRIYFAEHPEMLALLDENARITVEYNGIETQLYVSSITYKTTENDVLPEITVELKDEVTVTQNQVQKATNQLKSEIYRTLYDIDVVAQGTRVFLRKDQPDTALQPITFKSNTNLDGGATVDKKIESKDYFEGSKGLSIHKDENEQWHIETDYLHARKKFSAKEVEIQKVYHISGAQIKSSASMICSRVVELVDSYRCYFDYFDDDGNIIHNQFIIGDQAYVQTFNLIDDSNGNTTNHFYWRLVTAVDANSITLSKTICADGSTAPMVGDNIVQLGYQGEDRQERQVAVIDAGAGEGAPYYRQYVGINSFALPEPETQLKPNDNKLKGQVDIKEGSLLSGVIAIKDENDDKIIAVINGADNLVDEKGRKLVVATGVTNVTKEGEAITNIEATTKIYDDGTLALGDKVGMTGADGNNSDSNNNENPVRIWAGETEESKEGAPFRVLQDGRVIATNAEIKGKVDATDGELENVIIKGTTRSPFAQFSSMSSGGQGIEHTRADNFVSSQLDGAAMQQIFIPWTLDEGDGRRVTIVGNVTISAPTNEYKYFYENGRIYKNLETHNEVIELLGFSVPTTEGTRFFKGWIVTSRVKWNLTEDSNTPYGANAMILAKGYFEQSNGTTVPNNLIKTFDGSTLTITSVGVGVVNVTLPSTWNLSSANSVICMATTRQIVGQGTFTVRTAKTLNTDKSLTIQFQFHNQAGNMSLGASDFVISRL